jgi:peptidyl-dipeptidase Dcp
MSTSFTHIFSGGYATGYYSYKWAEVLAADAFAFFKQTGIFNRATAASFRREVLSRGDIEDADVLYRNWRGRDARPEALLEADGLVEKAG